MTHPTFDEHLSRIQTSWTMVNDAKLGEAAIVEARELLLHRYRGAVYRYIMAVVNDSNVADDLTQEFAFRFVRGDFRNADPNRGRFRRFVKTAVLNLVRDHYRGGSRQPDRLPDDDSVVADTGRSIDERFIDTWKQELLSRAWQALKAQTDTELPLYTVLHCRAEHPGLRSPQLAERLSDELGRTVTANWVRQVLFRARHRFAELLLQDVLHSMNSPTRQDVEDELHESGLYDYCAPALDRSSPA